MGALMRATRDELAVLSADPEWWGGQLDVIRESGSPAQLVGENVWSYGAFIGWVRSDERRSAEYDEALKDYAHRLAMDGVPIADAAGPEDVAVAKLRIDTRLRLAGKWDRARYGEQVKVDRGSGEAVVDAALVGLAGALLERLARPRERVIEVVADDDI